MIFSLFVVCTCDFFPRESLVGMSGMDFRFVFVFFIHSDVFHVFQVENPFVPKMIVFFCIIFRLMSTISHTRTYTHPDFNLFFHKDFHFNNGTDWNDCHS